MIVISRVRVNLNLNPIHTYNAVCSSYNELYMFIMCYNALRRQTSCKVLTYFIYLFIYFLVKESSVTDDKQTIACGTSPAQPCALPFTQTTHKLSCSHTVLLLNNALGLLANKR